MKTIRKRLVQVSCSFFLVYFFSQMILHAGNPIVPYVGMADPHIHIFNNRAYLYATRDADSTAQDFVMPDWNIWSSDDLIHWKLERTIYPAETYMGESTSCWAADVAYKNGSYYFYFSNGNTNTGVLRGTSPIGPFVDVLGKPLLHQDLTIGKEYDPSILVDDDQIAYLVFGHHRSYEDDLSFHIVKLNEDMMSLAEHPREIDIIHSPGTEQVLRGNDKPNLHKRDGIYYLSAGSHYATSEAIYGPYTTRGNSGNNKHGLDSRAHGNFFEWNNQWFHTWCYFHLGRDVARYRESYISYLHYKDNGDMVTDTVLLEKHFETGVGQYDATWDKIEAEWYMAASGVQKRENPHGGFLVQAVQNNGYLYYPNVKNIDKSRLISFFVSSESEGGIIDIRGNDPDGPLLGTVRVPNTGSSKTYEKITCDLVNSQHVKGVYIIFRGLQTSHIHIDWFNFSF